MADFRFFYCYAVAVYCMYLVAIIVFLVPMVYNGVSLSSKPNPMIATPIVIVISVLYENQFVIIPKLNFLRMAVYARGHE